LILPGAEAAMERKRVGILIGSVIVHRGRIIGRGHNRRMQRGSVVLHGEMDAFVSYEAGGSVHT
jgi:cytosine/creatinine deaminase